MVAHHCVIHCWKAVQKHYNLHWKLVGDFSFLRTLWLENWKYCWILASNVSSMMNTDYFPFLHGRVSKCLHFIFWSQFWNINHERIMDTFCHFSSLTWPIYLGFLIIQCIKPAVSRWSIIEHVEQDTYIYYCKSSGLSLSINKHNVLILSEFRTNTNPWLLVGLPCVIHHWKGLFNQIQVN